MTPTFVITFGDAVNIALIVLFLVGLAVAFAADWIKSKWGKW